MSQFNLESLNSYPIQSIQSFNMGLKGKFTIYVMVFSFIDVNHTLFFVNEIYMKSKINCRT